MMTGWIDVISYKQRYREYNLQLRVLIDFVCVLHTECLRIIRGDSCMVVRGIDEQLKKGMSSWVNVCVGVNV